MAKKGNSWYYGICAVTLSPHPSCLPVSPPVCPFSTLSHVLILQDLVERRALLRGVCVGHLVVERMRERGMRPPPGARGGAVDHLPRPPPSQRCFPHSVSVPLASRLPRLL